MTTPRGHPLQSTRARATDDTSSRSSRPDESSPRRSRHRHSLLVQPPPSSHPWPPRAKPAPALPRMPDHRQSNDPARRPSLVISPTFTFCPHQMTSLTIRCPRPRSVCETASISCLAHRRCKNRFRPPRSRKSLSRPRQSRPWSVRTRLQRRAPSRAL